MKKTCRPRKKIGLLSFALLIVFLFASACGTAPHPDADSLPPSSAVSRDEDSSVQPASLPPVSSEPEAAVAHTMDDFISYYWRHPIDTDLSALRNETISQVTGNGLCTLSLIHISADPEDFFTKTRKKRPRPQNICHLTAHCRRVLSAVGPCFCRKRTDSGWSETLRQFLRRIPCQIRRC